MRCSGTSVFLYKDECGYFEELNETSLQIAIRESISKDMDLKLTKHKIADVVHRIVSDPELQVNYDEFNSQIHLINFKTVSITSKQEPSTAIVQIIYSQALSMLNTGTLLPVFEFIFLEMGAQKLKAIILRDFRRLYRG